MKSSPATAGQPLPPRLRTATAGVTSLATATSDGELPGFLRAGTLVAPVSWQEKFGAIEAAAHAMMTGMAPSDSSIEVLAEEGAPRPVPGALQGAFSPIFEQPGWKTHRANAARLNALRPQNAQRPRVAQEPPHSRLYGLKYLAKGTKADGPYDDEPRSIFDYGFFVALPSVVFCGMGFIGFRMAMFVFQHWHEFLKGLFG